MQTSNVLKSCILVSRYVLGPRYWAVQAFLWIRRGISEDGHCEERGCTMLDAAAESKPAAKGSMA